MLLAQILVVEKDLTNFIIIAEYLFWCRRRRVSSITSNILSSQMGIDKNGGRCQRRRLRKLCDLDEHPLKQVDEIIDMPRVKVEQVTKVVESILANRAVKADKMVVKPKKSDDRKQLKLLKLVKEEKQVRIKIERRGDWNNQVRESAMMAKVRSLNASDKQDLAKIMGLAILSRRRGFVKDERVSRGDVRDTEHTQCSLSTLYFELVRRSSKKATTLADCKAEWVTNEKVGIGGWFCVGGVLAPSTACPLYHEDKRMVWLDDPSNDNWVEGQCLCLQTRSNFSKAGNHNGSKSSDKADKRAIKFRYSIRNINTGEVVVLGSTCIKNWGGEFAKRADDLYKWAVRSVKIPVPAKKWVFQ